MGTFPDCTRNCSFWNFIYLSFAPWRMASCLGLARPPVTFVRKCTYLFSVHSLPYLPLRKEGARDGPSNWGWLSAVTPGRRSSVSKSFSDKRAENAPACGRCTQASDVLYSSPTRLGERGFLFCFFFPRRRSWAGRVRRRLQPFSFLLSPWDCKQGRRTTLFSLMFGEWGEKKYRGKKKKEEQRGETSET